MQKQSNTHKFRNYYFLQKFYCPKVNTKKESTSLKVPVCDYDKLISQTPSNKKDKDIKMKKQQIQSQQIRATTKVNSFKRHQKVGLNHQKNIISFNSKPKSKIAIQKTQTQKMKFQSNKTTQIKSATRKIHKTKSSSSPQLSPLHHKDYKSQAKKSTIEVEKVTIRATKKIKHQEKVGSICKKEAKQIPLTMLPGKMKNKISKVKSKKDEQDSQDTNMQIEEESIKICPKTKTETIDDIKEKIVAFLKSKPDLRLNLILDLDETLVNSAWATEENKQGIKSFLENSNKNTINQTLQTPKNITGFVSVMRPHLKDFLLEFKDLFTVYVYSHGKKDYVIKILDKINPKRNVLDISRTFKNEGQVTSDTFKNIRNVIPSVTNKNLQSVLRQTIIVDDFQDVWISEARRNSVPIKRYQPLFEITKKVFPFVVGYEGKQPMEFSEQQADYYQDLDSNDHTNCSLDFLSKYLCSVAITYYNKLMSSCKLLLDIRDELAAEQLTVFKNKKFYLSLIKQKDVCETCKYLVVNTGGIVSESVNKACFALIQPEAISSSKKKLNTIKQEFSQLELLDVKWLIDSFFSHSVLDTKPYIIL